MDIAGGRAEIRLQAAVHAVKRIGAPKNSAIYPHLIVKKTNDIAAIRYVPEPYNGRVALIRSRGYFVGLTNPTFGWSDYVRGGLEVYELPVFPKGIFVGRVVDSRTVGYGLSIEARVKLAADLGKLEQIWVILE